MSSNATNAASKASNVVSNGSTPSNGATATTGAVVPVIAPLANAPDAPIVAQIPILPAVDEGDERRQMFRLPHGGVRRFQEEIRAVNARILAAPARPVASPPIFGPVNQFEFDEHHAPIQRRDFDREEFYEEYEEEEEESEPESYEVFAPDYNDDLDEMAEDMDAERARVEAERMARPEVPRAPFNRTFEEPEPIATPRTPIADHFVFEPLEQASSKRTRDIATSTSSFHHPTPKRNTDRREEMEELRLKKLYEKVIGNGALAPKLFLKEWASKRAVNSPFKVDGAVEGDVDKLAEMCRTKLELEPSQARSSRRLVAQALPTSPLLPAASTSSTSQQQQQSAAPPASIPADEKVSTRVGDFIMELREKGFLFDPVFEPGFDRLQDVLLTDLKEIDQLNIAPGTFPINGLLDLDRIVEIARNGTANPLFARKMDAIREFRFDWRNLQPQLAGRDLLLHMTKVVRKINNDNSSTWYKMITALQKKMKDSTGNEEDFGHFFSSLFSLMEHIVTLPAVPLLNPRVRSVTLSRRQIASYLATALVNAKSRGGFEKLLKSDSVNAMRMMDFLAQYIRDVDHLLPGTVSYRIIKMSGTQYGRSFDQRANQGLSEVRIDANIALEDAILCTKLESVSANLGGNFLHLSKLMDQEEGMYAKNPEIFFASILRRHLGDFECLAVVGNLQFSKSIGQGNGMRKVPWGGRPLQRPGAIVQDIHERINAETLLVPTSCHASTQVSHQLDVFEDDLSKLCIGLDSNSGDLRDVPVVCDLAMGLDGNSDRRVMFCKVLMGCMYSSRPLVYLVHNDSGYAEDCVQFVRRLQAMDVKLGEMLKAVKEAGEDEDRLSQGGLFRVIPELVGKARYRLEQAAAAAAAV